MMYLGNLVESDARIKEECLLHKLIKSLFMLWSIKVPAYECMLFVLDKFLLRFYTDVDSCELM